VLRAVEFRYF